MTTRTVKLTTESGGTYRAGLPPHRAAREMFLRTEALVTMLDAHGAVIVETPTWLKAEWEQQP